METFSTPRRIGVHLPEVASRQADLEEMVTGSAGEHWGSTPEGSRRQPRRDSRASKVQGSNSWYGLRRRKVGILPTTDNSVERRPARSYLVC